MSKQKRKLLATATPEKTPQDKTFVQVEGKLTEEQLEAIEPPFLVAGPKEPFGV